MSVVSRSDRNKSLLAATVIFSIGVINMGTLSIHILDNPSTSTIMLVLSVFFNLCFIVSAVGVFLNTTFGYVLGVTALVLKGFIDLFLFFDMFAIIVDLTLLGAIIQGYLGFNPFEK
jgi:hypothetical protein